MKNKVGLISDICQLTPISLIISMGRYQVCLLSITRQIGYILFVINH